MIKGCHKNIVFLKDTGSELFDEAYFILKPNAHEKKETDIISEATRIVNSLDDGSKRKGRGRLSKLFSFLAGALVGGASLKAESFIEMIDNLLD